MIEKERVFIEYMFLYIALLLQLASLASLSLSRLLARGFDDTTKDSFHMICSGLGYAMLP